MEKLHPGARWIFRLRTYSSFLFILIFLGFFIFGVIGSVLSSSAIPSTILVFIGILFGAILIVIIIGEIYAALAYNNWAFEFTSHELKIEKGIIWKTYKSIPYDRVQNIDIHRGIIARMLGYSSLDIQTAGYSGGYSRRGGYVGAEGSIPAVGIQRAEQLRDFVMKRITKKNSGM